MKPAVTVLIDTYNHERFIERAIVSVLEQGFPSGEVEILAVDDGSTDRTPEIIRKFGPQVRLIRKANGGQASAFNVGILEAKSEIVAFLDGDDWWAPNKLTLVVEALLKDPAIGIVGHGIVMTYSDRREESLTLRDGFRFRANTFEGAKCFRMRRAFLGTSRMTVRSAVLATIGLIPESIAIEADEYIFTLAAVLTDALILPETLTYYRLHDANAFQVAEYDPKRLHKKQVVLAALAQGLKARLANIDVEPQAERALTDMVQAEADQLSLQLNGGWSWNTVRTEWTIYRALHDDAPISHRVFKVLTLLPAFALPPRTYYAVRRRLIYNNLYLRARARWLPIPKSSHIGKEVRTSS
ncbi:MAG TPA: glycosyltransferase family A protein [Terriglobales bacterium]|jgi:glycosyltransferase involved in cell wall biosynthesis|nr:glycosyltransferase family A protein [Terriglobales bacterium]